MKKPCYGIEFERPEDRYIYDGNHCRRGQVYAFPDGRRRMFWVAERPLYRVELTPGGIEVLVAAREGRVLPAPEPEETDLRPMAPERYR